MTTRTTHVIASIATESSGPTQSVTGLCDALANLGQQLTLAVLGDMQADVPAYAKAFPNDGMPARLGRSAAMKRWLRQTAQRGEADIIHNHGLWMMPNVYACNAVRGNGTKLVVAPRGTLSEAAMRSGSAMKRLFWPLLQHPALRHVDCFHATSEQEAADIRRHGFTQPIAVIPNGVAWSPPKTANNAGARTLLYLGRLHPIKGLAMLLDAWAGLEPQHEAWHLRIVGPDHRGFRSTLEAQVARLNIARVDFSGELIGEAKWQAMANADLFILPSESENFGMAVAEALASGTPAVVTEGAPWQALDAHRAGWWIPHDKTAMQAQLDACMRLPATELAAAGERGRQWMREAFSWQAIGTKMHATYQWLLGDAPQPPWVHASL